MSLRRSSSLLLALALIAAAPAARAHGGIPRAYAIYFEPGSPDHIVLRSALWGIYQSRDGGQTWSWVCAEAYGGRSLTYEQRSLIVLPGGTVMVAAAFSGLQIAENGDLCNFTEAPAFVDELVQDVVATHPDGSLLHVLTSTGSTEGTTVQLWASTDRGVSWEPVGTPPPGDAAGNDLAASSLAIAPSDENRIYVAGKYVTVSTDGTVQRSDDGGQTWQASQIPVGLTSWTGRLVGVHPSNPDVVYFWMDKTEGGNGDVQADELWRSTDGAQTWNKVYSAKGDLPAFTFSPDGSTIAVAGPEDGLLMAPASGGGPFEQVFHGSVWGLSWKAEGLYAGNDDFTGGDLPKFTFGVSRDEGQSFEGLMNICQADLIACGSETRTATACAAKYSDPGGYKADYLESARCSPPPPDGAGGGDSGAGGAGSAAGAGAVGDDDTESEGGCACATPGSPRRPPLGAAIAFAVLAFRQLRRRRSC